MSTEQDKHQRGQLQHEADRAKPRKKSAVLIYLVILFAAAFLLLLMSYFMQQRVNQEAIDGLKETSTSAVQTLENLIQERDDLKTQVAALEQDADRLAALEQDARVLNDTVASLTRQSEAMQWFWQIDDYYARGYYTSARKLITDFEAAGLKDALPSENTTGTDRFSPAQRYQEIYDALY